MKKSGIIGVLIIIIFLLLAAGYAGGFLVYQEYKEKIAYFDEQNQLIRGKFSALQSNLESFNQALKEVVKSTEEERKETLSKIEGIKTDIQNWRNSYSSNVAKVERKIESIKNDIKDWQSRYTSAVAEVKQRIKNLKSELESWKKGQEAAKEVDLGEITVEKKGQEKKEE